MVQRNFSQARPVVPIDPEGRLKYFVVHAVVYAVLPHHDQSSQQAITRVPFSERAVDAFFSPVVRHYHRKLSEVESRTEDQ
jgi:hypothetical protein